jgi:nitrite reductase/ring-hydroxylating ferredoxin subunit
MSQRPNDPIPHLLIAPLTAIADGSGHAFTIGDPPCNCLIVRRGEQIYAYHNRCRHFGIPLNVRSEYRFIDESSGAILCQVHYARYAVEDGRCLRGDCDGDGLWPIAITIRDGNIYTASSDTGAA